MEGWGGVRLREGNGSYLVAGRANDAIAYAEHGRGDVFEGDRWHIVIVRGGGLLLFQ